MPLATRARAEQSLSPQRRRLFIAITIAAPWLLLLLVELALRVGGYGSSAPLFVPHRGHEEWLEVNPDVGQRWFRGGPFVPTPEVEYFRADKPRGAIRLFFQGESSAQGFPYGHGGMPSRMLERRLAAAFPGRDIEVVNVAFTAVNSWTLLDQVDEIVAQHPDAVLIYTGHNEWYGALGGRPRAMATAFLLVRHSRLAQLLFAGVSRLARHPGRSEGPSATDDAPRTVMQLMAGEQLVPLGSPAYERGLAQFRANMAELLERYRRAGIPVLIGTVASNVHDQPPLDGPDTPAARAFARAHALEAAGDSAAARAVYVEARDLDALRFRAPTAINTIIRELASQNGATVVETERVLAGLSPGGVVGARFMLEHLHPNLDGYAVIAGEFYGAMRKHRIGGPGRNIVTDDSGSARVRTTVTPIDSLIGALRTDRLRSGWPFQPRGHERTPMVDTLTPRTQVQQLAQAVVLGHLPWGEATERLRDAAERAGDHALALAAAAAMSQEVDWSPEPCLDAARAALAMGDDEEALRWTNAALARGETAAGQQLLGIVLLHQGQREAAIVRLRRAVQLAPGDRRAQAVLQSAEALPMLEQRLALAPRDTTVLLEIALAYAFTEQRARARAAVATLRRVAPGFSRLEQMVVIERTPGR